MKLKNFLTPFLVMILVSTMAFAVVPPQSAQAACSPNGFLNSQGRCVNSVPTNWNWSYRYNDRYYEYRNETLLALIEHLQEMIRQLEGQLDDQDGDGDVLVTTRVATNIDEDSAILQGRVYLDNEDEAEVYFEYGHSRTNLSEETGSKVIDRDGDYTFESRVDGLTEDTLYYFRAVAEDEEGDASYGATYSFRTKDGSDSDDSTPDLNTHEATSIDEHSAELSGSVDMNDYDSGVVFFVYGEDRSQVASVADDYDEYSDVDEDSDDLQKVLVDEDLDSFVSYQETVDGLDDNTDIYYSICVEYEDEDDDIVLACGDVESFETD